jgi:hypothetical protein
LAVAAFFVDLFAAAELLAADPVATMAAAPSHIVILLAKRDRNDKSTPRARQRGHAGLHPLCPARPCENRLSTAREAPYTGLSDKR